MQTATITVTSSRSRMETVIVALAGSWTAA